MHTYFQRARIPEKGAEKEDSNGISFLEQSLRTAIKVSFVDYYN